MNQNHRTSSGVHNLIHVSLYSLLVLSRAPVGPGACTKLGNRRVFEEVWCDSQVNSSTLQKSKIPPDKTNFINGQCHLHKSCRQMMPLLNRSGSSDGVEGELDAYLGQDETRHLLMHCNGGHKNKGLLVLYEDTVWRWAQNRICLTNRD